MSSTNANHATVDLSGRVALITGAGSGIGRAMALTFAAAGARIVVNDIIAERAHETVAMIAQAGGNAIPAIADIADEGAVAAFVDNAILECGQIDVLCNNAGIMDKIELAPEIATDLWNRVMAVNVTGQFFVTRAVLPHMLQRKYGSIINTASVAGLRGGGAGLAYTASKHAVVGFTRSLAWSHRSDGIRCNAICPGAIETNITNGAGLAAFNEAGLALTLPVMQLASSSGPQCIANMALFFASDASAFVTGTVVPVDGGWMAG